MTTHTSAAGVAHLAERDAPSPLTNAFDALELGKGNTTISGIDARDDIAGAAKLQPPGLLEVLGGYPVLGDDDVRNPGRAADRYTWAFRVSGVEHGPLVASTGWITNYAGGAPATAEPVGFAWDDVFQLRSDQVATIFFNAKTGSAATVHFVYEEVTSATATAATYSQRFPLLTTYPQGRSQSPGVEVVEVVEGSAVYIMARALGEFGHLVTPEEVTLVRPRVFVEDAPSGYWRERTIDAIATVEEAVSATPVVTDLRWPHALGYNVGLWVDLAGVAALSRVRIELELRTHRGLLEPPCVRVLIVPRAGRYTLL